MTVALRIVLLGTMGQCPYGGPAWLTLGWLRGLQRLGHDVWYVEDDVAWPYDPERETVADDCSYAIRHVEGCLKAIGLEDRWAFRFVGRRDATWGMSSPALDRLYAECDVLVNVFGATVLREEHMAAPVRVYLQTDPVTAELRLANGDEKTRRSFARHHRIATYGENYGAGDCDVPLNGCRYVLTRQPVDLELWPMSWTPDAHWVTTIGNYRQEGSDVEWRGDVYRWSKHHEWDKFLDLPSVAGPVFELALSIDADTDRDRLQTHSWRVVTPRRFSLDVFGAYRDYIRQSRAEFTVAKDQNIRLRSGWFSDRSACYLASGKPVITQDTGFSNVLPVGEGLFAVATPDEAAAAVETINADYRRHCGAARAIASEYFEATRVAGRLLRDLGLTG